MPELPEVETIKRYLERRVIGGKIKDVKVLDRNCLTGMRAKIKKAKILRIERKGKMLIFILNNGFNLIFHLKMTGQIIFLHNLNNVKISKATRVIFVLDRGYLLFNDIRRFGWIKIVNHKNLEKEMQKVGIDALNLNLQYLKGILNNTKRPIKLVLMDQTKIAGIGNIYANEILFLAKTHPLMPANQISSKKLKDLLKAIKKILKKAIKYEGTSFRSYLKPDESKGKYQENFLVYQKKGEKCFRCGAEIKKIILGGRSTFYCSSCQKML